MVKDLVFRRVICIVLMTCIFSFVASHGHSHISPDTVVPGEYSHDHDDHHEHHDHDHGHHHHHHGHDHSHDGHSHGSTFLNEGFLRFIKDFISSDNTASENIYYAVLLTNIPFLMIYFAMYLFEKLGLDKLFVGKKDAENNDKPKKSGLFSWIPFRKECLLSIACGSIISVTIFELMPDIFTPSNKPVFFTNLQPYLGINNRSTELKYGFIFGIVLIPLIKYIMLLFNVKTSCSHSHDHSDEHTPLHDHSHGHDHSHDHSNSEKTLIDSLGYIFADITHSFCEGLLISVAFVHSLKLGQVTILST